MIIESNVTLDMGFGDASAFFNRGTVTNHGTLALNGAAGASSGSLFNTAADAATPATITNHGTIMMNGGTGADSGTLKNNTGDAVVGDFVNESCGVIAMINGARLVNSFAAKITNHGIIDGPILDNGIIVEDPIPCNNGDTTSSYYTDWT